MASYAPDPSIFHKNTHIRYWRRCVRSLLPSAYTANDANRMMLGYFILSALDLLGVLYDETSEAERESFVVWIYACQHPDGGFRAFPGTNYGEGTTRIQANECWDPANLAGTFFAMTSLLLLGDDLERVERIKCLSWLARLQQEDGSFGEVLGRGGIAVDGQDVRFCYLAALVRFILKGHVPADHQDINSSTLARFVLSSQTYDGGIGQSPHREAHGGWSYCGIGALSLLGKLHVGGDAGEMSDESTMTPQALAHLLRWLVGRQTAFEAQDDETGVIAGGEALDQSSLAPDLEGLHLHDAGKSPLEHASDSPPPFFEPSSLKTSPHDAPSTDCPSHPLHPSTATEPQLPLASYAGFSGRCNKDADTCYSFWIGGSLGILKKVHLFDFTANRRFLLDQTQHLIGGFGKLPGDAPDILHSFLGLAALAVMKEPGLKTLDPLLCVSLATREHLESLAWRRRRRSKKLG